MFFSKPPHLAKADELKEEPPKGKGYAVPIPGTEQPGRSPIYRAWKTEKELIKTLDPQVYIYIESLGGVLPCISDSG